MRDWLTAVEEEGNAVAREDTAERGVMVVERAENDGAFTEAPAAADVAEDFAGGEGGLGFGVGADRCAEGMGNGGWEIGGWRDFGVRRVLAVGVAGGGGGTRGVRLAHAGRANQSRSVASLRLRQVVCGQR